MAAQADTTSTSAASSSVDDVRHGSHQRRATATGSVGEGSGNRQQGQYFRSQQRHKQSQSQSQIHAGHPATSPPQPTPISARSATAATAGGSMPSSSIIPRSNSLLHRNAAANDAEALSDAKFRYAVEMVQKLPKTGPVMTTYEDKLMLYSLYKQATEGSVMTSRPGMLDLLGRAKWDAWKKRESLSFAQAKEAYVQTLIGILRNFSDTASVARQMRDLINHGSPNPRTERDNDGRLLYSETSSHRSSSPPPSRRSYHSAVPDQQLQPLQTVPSSSSWTSAETDEGDETPRRYQGRASPQEIMAPRSRLMLQPDSEETFDEQEDEDEGEYTQSGSDPASDVAEASRVVQPSERATRNRSQGHESTLQPSQPLPSRRMTGPSPYQHPAQYPAPIPVQLSHDEPPELRSQSRQVPRRHGLPSVVPPVSTQPPYIARQNGGNAGGASLTAMTASGTLLPPGSARAEQFYALQEAQAQAQALQQQQQRLSTPAQQQQLERALDSIQTSLAALHERLHFMEHVQGELQARNTGASSVGLLAWIASSPILQLLQAIIRRLLTFLRLRQPNFINNGAQRASLSTLLGQALISLLVGARSLARDAVAMIFLAAAVASLRSTRGDWRAVVRAWARILAMASGIGVATQSGLLAGSL